MRSDRTTFNGTGNRLITCCNHCVAPKRYPGCHDHCDAFQTQRKAYLERVKQEKLDMEATRYTVQNASIHQNQAAKDKKKSHHLNKYYR